MLRYDVIQHNISVSHPGLIAPTNNEAANEQWKKMAPIKPAFWCFSKFHLNFLLFVQPPNFVPHGK